jgi:hypothetical protein
VRTFFFFSFLCFFSFFDFFSFLLNNETHHHQTNDQHVKDINLRLCFFAFFSFLLDFIVPASSLSAAAPFLLPLDTSSSCS